jgi:hypothetical protein
MRVLFIIVFIISAFSINVYGQRSAQAIMQVSVRVIKGVQVETRAKNHIAIDQSNYRGFDVGSIQMTGLNVENTIVVTPAEITVRSQDGEKFGLHLETQSGDRDGVNTISFIGSADSRPLKHGTYQGSLVTTIEYL